MTIFQNSMNWIQEIWQTSQKTKSDFQELKEKIEGKKVIIGISDRGKGISPQIMPIMFEKFVTGSDIGTSLGLYITQKLVEAHGGRIWAFNNNDGIGSTFVFTLPKSDDEIPHSK